MLRMNIYLPAISYEELEPQGSKGYNNINRFDQSLTIKGVSPWL